MKLHNFPYFSIAFHFILIFFFLDFQKQERKKKYWRHVQLVNNFSKWNWFVMRYKWKLQRRAFNPKYLWLFVSLFHHSWRCARIAMLKLSFDRYFFFSVQSCAALNIKCDIYQSQRSQTLNARNAKIMSLSIGKSLGRLNYWFYQFHIF